MSIRMYSWQMEEEKKGGRVYIYKYFFFSIRALLLSIDYFQNVILNWLSLLCSTLCFPLLGANNEILKLCL